MTQATNSILDSTLRHLFRIMLAGTVLRRFILAKQTDILREADAVRIDVVNHCCKLRVLIKSLHVKVIAVHEI